MKTIDKKYLKSLNPCEDRWKNYLKHHSDFSGSITEFLGLDKISFNDKKWVLFREKSFLPESLMREFALLCACRAVDDVNVEEISEYFNLVLLMFESGEDLKDELAYWAANRASYWAANMAADRAAYRAANRASYWAANMAAYWAAEEKIQLDILINLVEDAGL